jgi:RNA polymerase-binding protein DksA
MLTEEQRRIFRQRLLALKKRLGGDLTELENETLHGTGGEASGGLSNVPVHPADLGSDAYDQEVSLGLMENENKLLADIDDALHRIDEGTFGRCEECNRPISRERLEAIPYARYCLKCAQARDNAGR